MILFYALAVAVAVDLALTLVMIWYVTLSSDLARLRDSTILGAVVLTFASSIGHAGGILFLVLVAESIKIVLDIQANTQEAAFNSRHHD